MTLQFAKVTRHRSWLGAAGPARILTFDDEPVDGLPSAVARATYAQALGSVRCDASFVPKEEPAG